MLIPVLGKLISVPFPQEQVVGVPHQRPFRNHMLGIDMVLRDSSQRKEHLFRYRLVPSSPGLSVALKFISDVSVHTGPKSNATLL